LGDADAAGKKIPRVDPAEVRGIIRAHLESLYDFYGEETGVRVARKHFDWYCRQHPDTDDLRRTFVAAPDTGSQLALVDALGNVGATLVERAA
jgi:tRNA-dihydrouridine synthase B